MPVFLVQQKDILRRILMKFKLRRFMASLVAMAIIVTMIFSKVTVSFAASSKANVSLWYASTSKVGVVSELKAGYDHGEVFYAMIDGNSAYCMNYGKSVDGGQTMASNSSPKTSLSSKQEKLLELCMYYGFSASSETYPTSDQCNKFIATQSLVWIIEADLFGTSGGDSAARKICNSAPDASASYDYYESVRDKIDKSYNAKVPSFSSKDKSDAKTYELKWNEDKERFEITLTDSNKSLSNYDFTLSGYKVEKSGNNITIYTTSVDTSVTVGTFKSNVGAVKTVESCVYWVIDKSNYQEFISEKPEVEAVKSYIKVKTENIGYGKITKKDETTGVALKGATYGVYSDSKCTEFVEKVTTTDDGSVKTSGLVQGTYYVKEISAPNGYIVSDAVTTLSIKAGKTTSVSVSNMEQLAKITVNKVDKELNKATPQGDATLKGAVYGLYARNDIVHPDGETGTIYKAGELITKLTTDDKGQAYIDKLYLGNYYVKEITPSVGYLVDITEYDVKCEYGGDTVVEVSKSITSKEQVIKQPFQIIKIGDDGENTEAELLKNAGFSAYLKSALKKKADGTYDFNNSSPVVIGANGETKLYTDDKGYLVTSPLPYGTYIVVETDTPHNYKTIKPFEVNITEHNPSTPQTWRVFIDRKFSAKLRIIKKDADTKKTVLVPNAEFKIYDMDNDKYVEMITTYPSKKTHKTFFTDEDGDLVLPNNIKVGNYRIEEVTAPYGYVLNDKTIEVAIDTNTFYEIDQETNDAIITVEYEDEPVVGELSLLKKGEVLVGFDEVEKEFIYEMRGLKGAKYEIYVAEDIYTADNQLDSKGNRITYYKKGDLIATLETDDEGKAVLKDIPLGKYEVVEIEAPYGYTLDNELKEVTFSYKDDKTPVIKECIEFINDRQKVKMSVDKLDVEDNSFIEGAEFSLYADEDICNIYGDVIVAKDTLLEIAVSNSEGVVQFIKNYPFANYIVKESKQPKGYVSSDEVITFATEYEGQDKKETVYNSVFKNTPTTFEFTKTDITSGVELSGARLSVFNKEGELVDTWISEAKKPHIIKKLIVGETYKLVEELAPVGYLKAEDIEFTVEDTAEIQKVVMKDEVPTGTIVITKDGEVLDSVDKVLSALVDNMLDLTFNYKQQMLSGVRFNVYAKEDIASPDGLNIIYHKADDFIGTIESDENGLAIMDKLPLGKYYLIETNTLDGFILNTEKIDADVSYIDQYTDVVYAGMNITNERQKVEVIINKVDGNTNKALKGGIFGLYAKEDIVNSDGVIIVKANELVEVAKSNIKGQAIFKADLPLGKYYVKEISAPKGYEKSDEVYEIDALYNADKEKLVFKTTFKNYPIEVEIVEEKIDTVIDTPKTGDNSNMFIYGVIATISSFLLGYMSGRLKKKRKNRE